MRSRSYRVSSPKHRHGPRTPGTNWQVNKLGSLSVCFQIRPSQTCFLELRGRSLYEYERKLVPLYVNADRELFQHRPKRQFQLPDGGWRVGRAESDFHPGFQLEHEITGRAFEYTCRSWSVANHWMKLINEAMDGDGYKEGGGGGRHTQSTKV